MRLLDSNIFSRYFKKAENEPVHLSQQLVDGLSGIRMHGRLDPLPTHAVQLVDEDHAGSVAFSLP